MGELTLQSAVAQLYGEPPGSFVGSRTALVAQARDAGDKDLAKQIGALRRPTSAAYVINRLAAEGELGALVELGARLRQAQSDLDATAMKTLGTERVRLVDTLLQRAADVEPLTTSTKDQLTQTFTASIASPDAERAVTSGALVTALAYSGFGDVEISADAVAAATHLPSRGSANAPRKSANASRSKPNARRGSSNDDSAERARERERAAARRAATTHRDQARKTLDEAIAIRDEAERRVRAATIALTEAEAAVTALAD